MPNYGDEPGTGRTTTTRRETETAPLSLGPVPPGAIPRSCDATYRGYLAGDPQTIQLDSGDEMTTARIGVTMTQPHVPPKTATS